MSNRQIQGKSGSVYGCTQQLTGSDTGSKEFNVGFCLYIEMLACRLGFSLAGGVIAGVKKTNHSSSTALECDTHNNRTIIHVLKFHRQFTITECVRLSLHQSRQVSSADIEILCLDCSHVKNILIARLCTLNRLHDEVVDLPHTAYICTQPVDNGQNLNRNLTKKCLFDTDDCLNYIVQIERKIKMTVRDLKKLVNSIPERYLDNTLSVDNYDREEGTTNVQTHFEIYGYDRIDFNIVTDADYTIGSTWDKVIEYVKEEEEFSGEPWNGNEFFSGKAKADAAAENTHDSSPVLTFT